MQLKWENLTSDGRLKYTMSKTDLEHNVRLLPNAKKIISYYEEGERKDFIFPILKNAIQKADKFELQKQVESKTTMINNNLKKIQKLAKINTNITFHISRHSFAAIAKHRKVDIYEIKKLLGHSKISITEMYLAELGELPSDEGHSKALGSL
jgi:integrase/recombinase XerD